MKKLFAVLAAVMTVSAAGTSFTVSAEDSSAVRYYINAADRSAVSDGVRYYGSDTVQIDEEALANGGLTLNLGVYIDDKDKITNSAVAYWRADSEYIKLTNLLNPKETDLPFCYGTINEDGSYSVNSSYTIYTASYENESDKIDENTLALSLFNIKAIGNTTLEVMGGGASDAYPFARFDAVFDSQIPAGIYDIRMLSADSQDSHGGHSQCYRVNTQKDEPVQIEYGTEFTVDKLNVIVGEYEAMGDLNSDSMITASDASAILKAYADNATSGKCSLTGLQLAASDINGDGKVTPSDASMVLGCYAYNATVTQNEKLTIHEYVNWKVNK